MFARKLLTGVLAGGVAASVIGLTAGTAFAVYTPDPDDVQPASAADLVGVGSDTSQVVIKNAANAYNATNPAVKIATYAATNGTATSGTIAPPGGAEINRPNGSGAGKTTLYGSANNAGIDFARSSSANNAAETSAGLQAFPFALDTLGTVTSTTTNAPPTLTRLQLLDIYKGNTTNWSAINGQPGTIVPLIPQDGSGTRSFFLAQLQAENGGTAVTLGSNVTTFQENDDASIKNNPNAIAPFSSGRATILGTLRVEGGFSAQRALYNVFRQADLSAAGVQEFFGPNGFLCSADANQLIIDSGFQQLATEARGGVCGTTTQAAATNFTTNQVQNTVSSLAGSSPAANTARLVAGVSASSSPQGTFSFFEGANQLATNVPLVSGQATLNLTTAAGPHTYTAKFVPAGGSVFRRSQANATVIVATPGTVVQKAAATLSESFPASAKVKVKTVKGKKKTTVKPVSGAVTIASSAAATATGTITVKKGSTTVGTGTLSGGVASFKVSGLKAGTNNLTATYAGDAATNAGTLSFTVKAKKPKKK